MKMSENFTLYIKENKFVADLLKLCIHIHIPTVWHLTPISVALNCRVRASNSNKGRKQWETYMPSGQKPSLKKLLKELRFKDLYPRLSNSSGKDYSIPFSETFARGSS